MPKNWSEAKLQNFINSQIEESLTLEYKSAEALDRNETKKKEITKDVSAMANSAGGILIYGISEYSQIDKRHLPERITPVNRTEFLREWVEQIIQAIRPRIDGISIYSVNLSSGENDAPRILSKFRKATPRIKPPTTAITNVSIFNPCRWKITKCAM